MWPWGHLAFAYLFASAYGHWRWRAPPSTRVALLIGVGSQLPDLIDKPLAWGLGVLPAGRSLAHSLLIAGPLLVVLSVAAIRSEREGARYVVGAFAIAYLSHLLGDVIYTSAMTHHLDVGFLLWPLVPVSSGGESTALLAHVGHLVAVFRVFLASPRGQLYILCETALLSAGLIQWLRDGRPGIDLLRAAFARVVPA